MSLNKKEILEIKTIKWKGITAIYRASGIKL
jgi:hypothetical protein